MIHIMVAGYVLHDKKILLVFNKKLRKWLPFGGKILSGETPDSALLREGLEELSIDIIIFPISPIPTNAPLAVPFDVNVVEIDSTNHTVLYYLCKAKDISKLQINSELLATKWVDQESVNTIDDEHVKSQCLHIFSLLALQGG